MKFSTFCTSVTSVERFEPVQWNRGIPCVSGVDFSFGKKLLEKLQFEIDIELRHTSLPESEDPEASILTINSGKVIIESASDHGLLFGIQTLTRYCDVEQKFACRIIDVPKAKERGVKLYLPSPDEKSMQEFYGIIDLALQYKYNFLMLELGGAMEYQSHPEINAAYLEYAAFMNEFPGKAMQIQNQYGWHKNSIHTDNGGGRIVPVSILRDIAAYCAERHMEIIPEVPSLSHCDYLLAAHPELAERPEDPYPDTACPSKQEYYTILFDILEEVIEVFAPSRINIGHDEYYSIALCPECSKKNAAQIYADDINRTAEFLKKHGVKTIIWGEKLLDAHFRSGEPCGGADIPFNKKLNKAAVPPTFPAMELTDKDVEIFHWYWSIDRKLDLEYDRRGRKYLFGNFGPAELPDWKIRSSRKNFSGICVSNWGRSDFETMRRNGIIFDLIYASCLCWNHECGSEDYADLCNAAADELQTLMLKRFPADTKLFAITHTVETPVEFAYFFDGNFIDEKDFFLGTHIFESGEKQEFRFPVVFGKNISNSSCSPVRGSDPRSDFDRYDLNRQYIEILGGAIPECIDGETWYTAFYPHPAPGKVLKYKGFVPAEKNYNFEIKYKESDNR